MEAMSIERLLLSSWEEKGFVGQTRVPIEQSDVDVLAVNYQSKTVGCGQCKVTEGPKKVYVIDEYNVARSRDGEQFWWLTGGYADWLGSLPKIWDAKGDPTVAWLPTVEGVASIKVVLCFNVWILPTAQPIVNQALRAIAEEHFRKNSALRDCLNNTLIIDDEVKSTVDVFFDLADSVCNRIDNKGYAKRFGEPVKDLVRELHRFLHCELDRIPLSVEGNRLDSRKAGFRLELQRKTVIQLLKSLGIDDLKAVLTEE
jgi:hypothetical protein